MILRFIIFFVVILGIYGGAVGYVALRGWQALEYIPTLRPWVIGALVVSAFSYLIARMVEGRLLQNSFSNALVWYGSMWLGIIVYLLLCTALIDLVRSWATIAGHSPLLWTSSYVLLKFWTAIGITLCITGMLAYGLHNALTPRVVTIEHTIHKYGGLKANWNIVLVTDIHVGTIVDRTRVQQLVGSIRELEPDLVLLGGDTVDEDLGPVMHGDIGNVLKQIDAPYGTFAIPGNHEYIGGIEPALAYLREHEITVLRDETARVDDSFYLVGRDDLSRERYYDGTHRKTLDELLSGVDTTRPVIVLDHQPFNLSAVAQDGRVDMQFSGHTHNGQMWPFNYITKLIFENSWGAKTIGNTFFYVSSGWGTWGPPFRLGNTPEVIDIHLHFDGTPA
jgi:hypothetical protein